MVQLVGMLIQVLTFPGVIVHEFAHKLCCDILNVKVFEVKYFQLNNPAGYVRHQETSYANNFWISIAPIIVCTAVAAGILSWRNSVQHEKLSDVLFWLGISIAVNAFPSKTDADNLWRATVVTAQRNKLIWFMAPI